MTRSEEPDEERVARFRRFYEDNYVSILGYALRRTSSADDADDVVAETFLVLWRRLDHAPSAEELRPVNVIPASPGLVGTITFMDNASFEPIYGPEGSCLLPGGGTRCIVGLRVPADFKGSWEIEVNGTTAPGQQYVSTQDALAPGEELHCSGVRGMTVAQANPILEDLGVTVVWPEGVSQSSMSDQFIGGTDPVSPGTVRLHVQQRPLSKNEPSDSYYDALNRGC